MKPSDFKIGKQFKIRTPAYKLWEIFTVTAVSPHVINCEISAYGGGKAADGSFTESQIEFYSPHIEFVGEKRKAA